MSDMAAVIIPRSDQKNADDLLAGPITIKITKVTVRPGIEQPVSVFFEGDDSKPWKPCKSMARCLVNAWGADSSKYVGRSLTLYCDPKVKWGGMEVGGIRVSHMSDIESPITMALTVTRANKKPYTVKPLKSDKPKTVAPTVVANTKASEEPNGEGNLPDATATITETEALTLESRCEENGINIDALKKAAKVEKLSLIKSEDLPRCHQWLDKAIEKRKVD